MYVCTYVCVSPSCLMPHFRVLHQKPGNRQNQTKAVFALSRNSFAMGWMFIACSRKCNLSAPVAAFVFSIIVLKQYSQ